MRPRLALAACVAAGALPSTGHAFADAPRRPSVPRGQQAHLDYAHLLSEQLAANAPTPPGTPNLTAYLLPSPAVCINGCPADVQASVRDPSLWVITLGGLSAPGGAGWCLTPEACAWEAAQPWNATDNKPADPRCFSTPPPPSPLSNGGLQNTDCDENPTFCKASHAMISGCDLAMWIGDGVASYHGKNGDGNGTL